MSFTKNKNVKRHFYKSRSVLNNFILLIYFLTINSLKDLLILSLIEFAVAAAAMDSGIGYVDQNQAQMATLRSYFPETWLWELVPIGYD